MNSIAKNIIFYSISILIGALFIFSGYVKLYPIEPFEFTFVDLGIANWRTAPFIARIFISLEFFIGALLIFNVYMKKFTVKFTIAVLVIFNFYLLLVLLKDGNSGNCGCFGNVLVMTPLQALGKNIIIILLLLPFLYRKSELDYGRFTRWIIYPFLLISLVMPHVLNYIDFSYSESYLKESKINQSVPLDTLYNNASYKKPVKDLDKGKKILVFMSLKCPHCKIAAKKIRLINRANRNIPFFLVFNGETSDLQPFFTETKISGIPYCFLLGKPFIYLAGTTLPTIYLLSDAKLEFKINYLDLDQSELEKWLEK